MQEELPVGRRWNHRLITIPILLMSISFIAWAIVSDVDELVKGSGKVIPSSFEKVLQHLEGGIVKKIYVKEGDRVKKGDPIYRLKNSTSKSDSKEKEITLHALKLKEMRLKAELDFKDNLVLNDNSKQAENQLEIFKNDMKNFSEEKSILQDQLDQNRLDKRKKEQKLKNLQAQYKTQQEKLSIVKRLKAKGAASKQQYLSALAKLQSIKTDMQDIKSSIPVITKKIKSSILKIKKLKSDKKREWLKKLNDILIKIDKLNQKHQASKDRESRKIIKSPVNGVVQKLYFHTIGGIVKPGDRVAEITPIDDNLIIKAKIKANDRGNILVGQNVSISITAYSYTKYGFLHGKLISISPDSFTDRNSNTYYEVLVKADHYSFAPNKPILPGMIAKISIKTGKKSVARYLLKPLKDITSNALTER